MTAVLARVPTPLLVIGVLVALFFLGLVAFLLRVRLRGWPEILDPDRRVATAIVPRFLMRYFIWLIEPVETSLARLRVTPTQITITSLLVSIGAGVLAAFGDLVPAAMLYLGAGLLDILDGRVARRSKQSSSAGALVDSVLDRWGELAVLGGLALLAPDRLGVAAALACLAGSQMVSYTRARGESLGIPLAGGTMQRAERIILVSVGMLAAALGRDTGAWNGALVLTVVLLTVGGLSSLTAIARLLEGAGKLERRDRETPVLQPREAGAAPPADQAAPVRALGDARRRRR